MDNLECLHCCFIRLKGITQSSSVPFFLCNYKYQWKNSCCWSSSPGPPWARAPVICTGCTALSSGLPRGDGTKAYSQASCENGNGSLSVSFVIGVVAAKLWGSWSVLPWAAHIGRLCPISHVHDVERGYCLCNLDFSTTRQSHHFCDATSANFGGALSLSLFLSLSLVELGGVSSRNHCDGIICSTLSDLCQIHLPFNCREWWLCNTFGFIRLYTQWCQFRERCAAHDVFFWAISESLQAISRFVQNFG